MLCHMYLYCHIVLHHNLLLVLSNITLSIVTRINIANDYHQAEYKTGELNYILLIIEYQLKHKKINKITIFYT